MTITGGSELARLTLNGLLIGGDLHVTGELAALEIVHCTLVRPPGRRFACKRSDADRGRAERKARRDPRPHPRGGLRLPVTLSSVTLRDTILDSEVAMAADDTGTQPGPPALLERTTLLGRAHVTELTLASECIFSAAIEVDRRQTGCVRYSFVARR